MTDFQSSLLREKFTITETENADADPIIAVSNRMAVNLTSDDGIDNETFIIRTQNMHSCARFSAAILKDFHEHGTLANRTSKVAWDIIWEDVIKGYERDWNEDIWCAVYHKGRLVYQDGVHHPFLDIIEQCDAAQKNEYNQSVVLAEEIFGQAGKRVKIKHDSNVALILSIKDELAKAGVIVRSGAGTTTFNFTAEPLKKNPKPLHPYTVISVAASFLENIQLGFFVGLMNKKLEYKLFAQFSDEDRKHKRATIRLGNLNKAINNFENHFDVKYRPDRPTNTNIVQQAEEAAIKILKHEIQEKLDEGEIDSKDWVV